MVVASSGQEKTKTGKAITIFSLPAFLLTKNGVGGSLVNIERFCFGRSPGQIHIILLLVNGFDFTFYQMGVFEEM